MFHPKNVPNFSKGNLSIWFLTGIYHGDLTYQERHTVQHQFINNEIPIIVATSAFGMGINKKIYEPSYIFI